MQTRAEIIVENARVLTMDPDAPRAEAIALAGGEILAIGTRAAVAALAGADTRFIDARGGTVLPGFIESHMHLFVGGAELDHLQLAGVKGFDRLAQAVRVTLDILQGHRLGADMAAAEAVLGVALDRQDLHAALLIRGSFNRQAADGLAQVAGTVMLGLAHG